MNEVLASLALDIAAKVREIGHWKTRALKAEEQRDLLQREIDELRTQLDLINGETAGPGT